MKRPREGDRRRRKVRATRVTRNPEQVTKMLKACLQKVCELQADLQRTDEEENDAEAAGYAACAVETMRFLAAEGLPPDHPVVSQLRDRLMRDRD